CVWAGGGPPRGCLRFLLVGGGRPAGQQRCLFLAFLDRSPASDTSWTDPSGTDTDAHASAGYPAIAYARAWRATDPPIRPRGRAEVGRAFPRTHARLGHARHI